jgi:hypothetical protein
MGRGLARGQGDGLRFSEARKRKLGQKRYGGPRSPSLSIAADDYLEDLSAVRKRVREDIKLAKVTA